MKKKTEISFSKNKTSEKSMDTNFHFSLPKRRTTFIVLYSYICLYICFMLLYVTFTLYYIIIIMSSI